jgi:SHS2 domain-containing protein
MLLPVYRWIEHTAELQLEIDAPDERAVFADALSALAELLEDDGDGAPEQRALELEAPDRAGLLAAWLDELVYLADAERFVPEALLELDLQGQRLEATVRGYLGNPRPLVKAVTRHDLAFAEEAGRCYARVVLDV